MWRDGYNTYSIAILIFYKQYYSCTFYYYFYEYHCHENSVVNFTHYLDFDIETYNTSKYYWALSLYFLTNA